MYFRLFYRSILNENNIKKGMSMKRHHYVSFVFLVIIPIALILATGSLTTSAKTASQDQEYYSQEIQEISSTHMHQYNIITVSPTCTTKGYQYNACGCGKVYISNGKIELPHNYVIKETIDPTCTEDGYSIFACKTCDAYLIDNHIEMLAHEYIDQVIDPTIDAEGYTLHNCIHCEYSYIDNYTEKLPTVYYDAVDEYLYVASENLNVRTGPGVEYDKVDRLSQNARVHRVGKGDNGWSKIEINGEIFFVSSNYLSYNKVELPKVETVLDEIARRGNLARLTIPSVGVNVALFDASLYGGAQAYVDAYDSAAYMRDSIEYYGFEIIGDHRHQGFNKMKNSTPGHTCAYIDYGTHKVTYICVDIFKGYNTGKYLVHLNGEVIAGENNGGICMYTCNLDDTITISFWQPI